MNGKKKNNYARLKNEADISNVIGALGIPVTKKGSAYFIPCPNPAHNDQHATNCYFKEGWNNVYCRACLKSMMGIDLIMHTLGYGYGEAADYLWELEGKPDWYYAETSGKGKQRMIREVFDLTREESEFIGIHYPGRVLLPVNQRDTKYILPKGRTYDPKEIDSYLECTTHHYSWQDFMSEEEYIDLVIAKAKEKYALYSDIKEFLIKIEGLIKRKTQVKCSTNSTLIEAADTGQKRCMEIYMRAEAMLEKAA